MVDGGYSDQIKFFSLCYIERQKLRKGGRRVLEHLTEANPPLNQRMKTNYTSTWREEGNTAAWAWRERESTSFLALRSSIKLSRVIRERQAGSLLTSAFLTLNQRKWANLYVFA